MVVIAAGVMLTRASRVVGLPDIGDPFDVPAFRALNTLPEDQDANVLIRRAAAMATKMPERVGIRQNLTTGGWSQVDPRLRDWLENNRNALALFRAGTERPDGIMSGQHVETGKESGDLKFGPLVWLAMLEGSRLEHQGDMERAWSWYRTLLRLRLLVMRRGSVHQRWLIDAQCEVLRKRAQLWAADRKTGNPLVRRALDDVLACEPKPEWDAYSLKIEYLSMLSELSRPDGWVQHGSGPELDYRVAGAKLPRELTSRLYAVRRLVSNESELSRRVLRLAFANWLANAQKSESDHRRPSVFASFEFVNRNVAVPFFAAGTSAPKGARIMPPDELARWLLTARDARWLLHDWPWWSVRISEKRTHAGLVVLLAQELYDRDHGTVPRSDEALVGAYLDHLPDDGSNEVADREARWVRQSTGLALEPE
jgi:hypothetical protein